MLGGEWCSLHPFITISTVGQASCLVCRHTPFLYGQLCVGVAVDSGGEWCSLHPFITISTVDKQAVLYVVVSCNCICTLVLLMHHVCVRMCVCICVRVNATGHWPRHEMWTHSILIPYCVFAGVLVAALLLNSYHRPYRSNNKG